LLVITDFLSRDRIITHNAHSLLKPLILDNDPLVLKLLPLIEASSASDGAEEKDAFIDGIYSLIDSVTEGMFNELFAECGLEVAKHSSKAERADKELTSERSLIYGEVEFRSFTEVLRKICTNVPAGGTFIDIGSGSGKAVMAARMTQDFSTCVGVEIMDGLAALADEIGEKYERDCIEGARGTRASPPPPPRPFLMRPTRRAGGCLPRPPDPFRRAPTPSTSDAPQPH
jgi:hypothetical protein